MRLESAELGSALLTAVAASAALVVPVTLLWMAAAGAHEVAAFHAEQQQAERLAAAVILQTVDALRASRLPLPEPRQAVRVRNGVRQGDGSRVNVARFDLPTLDESDPGVRHLLAWPSVTAAPAPGLGVGGEVEVARVLGPRGDSRGKTRARDGTLLLQVRARAWFRRGVAVVSARLLVREGRVEKLD